MTYMELLHLVDWLGPRPSPRSPREHHGSVKILRWIFPILVWLTLPYITVILEKGLKYNESLGTVIRNILMYATLLNPWLN